MVMVSVDEREGSRGTRTSVMEMQVGSHFLESNLALYIKSFNMFIHFAILLSMYPEEILTNFRHKYVTADTILNCENKIQPEDLTAMTLTMV